MHMIKDVLNVPEISITNFQPKSKLQTFAFARQINNHDSDFFLAIVNSCLRVKYKNWQIYVI